ncbi:peptidylprolyl isomerase [Rhodoflexus caldus]|uniref:peptidylprolyl isomerase n=1 Tax=Rhodoflexus caldus TaxID=2891236 RepID=UPI002029CC85|nr:peptidylprolyl isomerase [Rhodoflexus caldus]
MKYMQRLLAGLVIFGLLTACEQSSQGQSQTTTAEISPDKDVLITISTPMGEMHAILYEETKQHRDNFIKLVKEKYYDDLLFHRCIKDFMIQGGDPQSRGAAPGVMLGNNGPGYFLPAEFMPDKYFHEKGAICAARKGDQVNPEKQSDGSQFYIVQGKTYTEQELLDMRTDLYKLYELFQQLLTKPAYASLTAQLNELQQRGDNEGIQKLILQHKDICEKEFGVELDKPLTAEQIQKYTTIGGVPFLDGEYTVFGKILDGFDVLDKIAAQPGDRFNRPNTDIPMKISSEVLPKAEITKRFGYQYPATMKK